VIVKAVVGELILDLLPFPKQVAEQPVGITIAYHSKSIVHPSTILTIP